MNESIHRSVSAGVSQGVAASVSAAVRDAMSEVFAAARNGHRQTLERLLTPGEQLTGFEEGELNPPFLLRVLPFVGDLLFRRQYFLIAVTNRRLLIVQLTNPLVGRRKEFQRIVASLPLSAVQSVDAMPGMLTSAIRIGLANGACFEFSEMLKSAPERLATEIRRAQSTADAVVPSENYRDAVYVQGNPTGIGQIARGLGVAVGAIFSLSGISVIAEGKDPGPGVVVLILGLGLATAMLKPWRWFTKSAT